MELSEKSQEQLRYWDLKQRLAIALQHAWPGMAGTETVGQLEAIKAELSRLLDSGELPPFVEPREIHRQIADAQFQLAILCYWFRGENLGRHYESAAQSYERAGVPEMACYCWDSAASAANRNVGNIDAQLIALRKAVESASASVSKAVALADLGDLSLWTRPSGSY